jgi:hypothetical protein
MAECIGNVKEPVDELKSATVNGCWKKLWPEAINDFWEFLNQQDKVRNALLLTYEVLG